MATSHFFYVFKGEKDEWRWRFYAPGNDLVCVSARGYHSEDDCLANVNLVAAHTGGATIKHGDVERVATSSAR